ncbi:RING-H2 finger protein ATL33-like isoform X2 [Vespa velutina]|uniref:RING-H2 finger protein ATL33-like isoform X2 n=1 Tax=Vespa velutina TaxID=202808 RepID=UPI001FB1C6EB|nr:RING-H2 finger protein ATL33-like isoform X2 [Vespa velutina]
MAFQGITIVVITVGLASLLYYFLANNGRQEQSYGYRSSGGPNGPDIRMPPNFFTANSPSNNEQQNQYRKRRSKRPFKDVCTICFQNVSDQDKVLLCGHCFHEKCIEEWRTRGPMESRNTCPTCREKYQNI